MKIQTNRWIALTVLAAMLVSTLGVFSITPAEAGAKGKRNTAIALGAVTAYGLLKKKKTVAIAGAAGTAYAYSKYRSAKKQENRDAERRARRENRRYRWRR